MGNGLAALGLARRLRPEVILVDIGLPDFKGYNVARQLKWEPGLERTSIIVITGEPLNRIRAGNTERMLAGVPQSREFRTGQPFAGQHRERQIDVAKQLPMRMLGRLLGTPESDGHWLVEQGDAWRPLPSVSSDPSQIMPVTAAADPSGRLWLLPALIFVIIRVAAKLAGSHAAVVLNGASPALGSRCSLGAERYATGRCDLGDVGDARAERGRKAVS